MQEEHTKLIRRLCKPGDEILESLTPEKCHMWHMTSCLLGEAVELEQGIAAKDIYNIIEELGDMQFYLMGFIIHLGRLFIYFPPKKSVGVSVAAADLFDIVKKHVIYGKVLDYGRIMEAINQIRFEMIRVRSDVGVDNDTVIKANIDKLNRRYPTGGYQNADAIARADKCDGPESCHLCNDCGFPGVWCMACGKEDFPPKDPPTVNLMTGVLTGAGKTSKTAWCILLWLIVLFLLLLFMPGYSAEPARPMIHIPDRVEIHSIQEAAQPATTHFQEGLN